MIKCIGYLKSLKQLFIIGLISCFILLGNSFVKADWYFHDVNEEYSVSNATEFTQKILSSSAGILEGVGMQPKALIITQGYLNSTAGQRYRVIYYWNTNNELNYIRNTSYNNNSGFYNIGHYHIDTFYRFEGTGFENSTTVLNISRNGEAIDVDSFYTNAQLKGAMTRTAYLIVSSSNTYQSAICFVYDNLNFSICAIGNPNYGSTQTTIPSGASIDPVNFDIDIIGTSPWTTNAPTPTPGGNNQVGNGGELDGVNYTVIDTGDIVYYFENNPYYRFDKGVCYVGTNDFNTLYSSGSTLGLFRANSGGTIFDLFSDKFGNTFTINQVGTFINARNLNYFTWFKGGNRDENNVPMFNAYYSINSGFYQDFSDDLIVPFIGNPIAFYFMGYVSSLYGEYSTPGQAISTYCYYKLGLDKDSGSMNITDDSDSSYWNNASDFINQRNKFYGLSSGFMIIQSQSWSGTILDYFTGGQDNYDFNTFFSSSFNKFKDKISLNLSDLGAGFLPTWIIMFLIAIIFFRFLSH